MTSPLEDANIWDLVAVVTGELDSLAASESNTTIAQWSQKLKVLHSMNEQHSAKPDFIRRQLFGLALEKRLYLDKLRGIEEYISQRGDSTDDEEGRLLTQITQILYEEEKDFRLVDRKMKQ
ncbi:hypothetical protein PROFUN_05268 [Planoprotostelium fungivorum]|uniref:Uncharacterized protein n=1 Tax=Planoprotostelium fungivorum TaxID=1890364 RepID=A0A2P6NR99_9EUKA|nr:hypothetical protein PROFUN_05268 [Planoprotostelium fungivorum]